MTATITPVFVAAGEILIDFISREPCVPLKGSASFGKFFGGAPANVAMNMKYLGVESVIVSKVGSDGLGDFLIDALTERGMDARYVTRHPTIPTSIVVLTSKKSPAEFVAYRQADTQLLQRDIPDELIRSCRIFHATAHGIARRPTQDTILGAFERARDYGRITSFDPNYSPLYWPDRDEALAVIDRFLALTTFCKPSLDDCERMFGAQPLDAYLTRLHDAGVKHVMLTRGPDGALFSSIDGTLKEYPALPVQDLVDPTGAGDAFTAGFFAAYLATEDVDHAMRVAIKTASFSLRHLGAVTPLPRIETLL